MLLACVCGAAAYYFVSVLHFDKSQNVRENNSAKFEFDQHQP
jgi:hypothetical protein